MVSISTTTFKIDLYNYYNRYNYPMLQVPSGVPTVQVVHPILEQMPQLAVANLLVNFKQRIVK